MSYCTEANFTIDPIKGTFTHQLTSAQLASNGSCCQQFVCGLACPLTIELGTKKASVQFGLPILIFAACFAACAIIIGLRKVKGEVKSYFVCARSLPLLVVSCTLLAQGLDGNATIGNISNAYKFAFWDGAVLPLGLGISLVLNGIFLAHKIQRMGLLTLPDLFKRKYGSMMEVMVSFIELASFTFLIAGNLVSISLLLQYCFGLPKIAGIIVSGALMAAYVCVGGLFSLAYTDIGLATVGFTGLLITVIYAFATDNPHAATPSLGYTFNLTDPAGNATMYASTIGYAGTHGTCTDPVTGAATCDNFAYPYGDKVVNNKGMTDTDAYAPFPNAIVMNWSTLFVLGLGNMCALDFQARSMSSKTANIARLGNIIAGVCLIGIAVPYGLLASLVRKHYGPDSAYAEYAADTCSAPLGLPSCAEWKVEKAFPLFQFLFDKLPRVLGIWSMATMLCASMSTADGAILATSTVAAHNLWRKVPKLGTSNRNLLWVARLFVIPMTAAACIAAGLAYDPGYCLIVAFDIVFASVWVPLMAAVYWPGHLSCNAGIISLITGCITRVTMQFALPHDQSLVFFGAYALWYGKAVPGLPIDGVLEVKGGTAAEAGLWNPDVDTCHQQPMRDWTGIDSLVSPAACLLAMALVWAFERIFPQVDLLFFVPKEWRTQEPLYQLDECESTSADVSHAGKEGFELGVKDASVTGMKPDSPAGLVAHCLDMEDSAHPRPINAVNAPALPAVAVNTAEGTAHGRAPM